MHELSIVIEVAKAVEEIALENGITAVDTIVLQIGEISTVIPHYVEECYPAAVDGTMLEKTKLKLEIIKATAICNLCHRNFDIVPSEGFCPECHTKEWTLLTGKEFILKEIIVT